MTNPWATPQITALWIFFGVVGLNAVGLGAAYGMLPRTPLARRHECSGWASMGWVLSLSGGGILIAGAFVSFGLGIGAALLVEAWLMLTAAGVLVRQVVARSRRHHLPTLLRSYLRDVED